MTVRYRAPTGAAPRNLPRNWRPMRLDEATARAVAKLLTWAAIGACDVLPGTKGWLVLLVPTDAPDTDRLVCLATLGDAAAYLRRAWRWDGPHAGPTRFNAQAQVREVLQEITTAVLAELGSRREGGAP